MDKAKLTIEYCTQCQWLLRATWMMQELLTTFSEEIDEIALKPGKGGVFQIRVEDKIVFDRKTEGSFLEIKFLKQKVRDLIAPDKYLGHSDVKS